MALWSESRLVAWRRLMLVFRRPFRMETVTVETVIASVKAKSFSVYRCRSAGQRWKVEAGDTIHDNMHRVLALVAKYCFGQNNHSRCR